MQDGKIMVGNEKEKKKRHSNVKYFNLLIIILAEWSDIYRIRF